MPRPISSLLDQISEMENPPSSSSGGNTSSTATAETAQPSKWLDAHYDPVAGLYTFTQVGVVRKDILHYGSKQLDTETSIHALSQEVRSEQTNEQVNEQC